jgi:hypothetical protein
VTGHFNRPDLFDFRFNGGARKAPSGQLEVATSSQVEIEPPTATEVLLQPSTEVLAPSGTDSAPAFRVISSSRSGSFDSELRAKEKQR